MKTNKLNKRNTVFLDLLKIAKAKGVTQRELAERAGLTPVGLTQAKIRGDMRLSTLEAIADALDMEITLTPSKQSARDVQAIKEGNFFRLKGSAA